MLFLWISVVRLAPEDLAVAEQSGSQRRSPEKTVVKSPSFGP